MRLCSPFKEHLQARSRGSGHRRDPQSSSLHLLLRKGVMPLATAGSPPPCTMRTEALGWHPALRDSPLQPPRVRDRVSPCPGCDRHVDACGSAPHALVMGTLYKRGLLLRWPQTEQPQDRRTLPPTALEAGIPTSGCWPHWAVLGPPLGHRPRLSSCRGTGKGALQARLTRN